MRPPSSRSPPRRPTERSWARDDGDFDSEDDERRTADDRSDASSPAYQRGGNRPAANPLRSSDNRSSQGSFFGSQDGRPAPPVESSVVPTAVLDSLKKATGRAATLLRDLQRLRRTQACGAVDDAIDDAAREADVPKLDLEDVVRLLRGVVETAEDLAAAACDAPPPTPSGLASTRSAPGGGHGWGPSARRPAGPHAVPMVWATKAAPEGCRVRAELRRITSGGERMGKLMKKSLRHYCFTIVRNDDDAGAALAGARTWRAFEGGGEHHTLWAKAFDVADCCISLSKDDIEGAPWPRNAETYVGRLTTPEPGVTLGRLSHCFVLHDQGLPIDVAGKPEKLARERGVIAIDAATHPSFMAVSVPIPPPPGTRGDANEWRPTEARESIAHQELAIINADSMADIMARRKDARPVRRFDVASGLQPSPEAVKSRKNFKLIAQDEDAPPEPALQMAKVRAYGGGSNDVYEVQFTHPFSPSQAFAICMSRFLIEI